jgi:hypothetical protein
MIRKLAFLLAVIVITSCASRPCCTDYVVVTPVELVPPTTHPGGTFGWLETNEEKPTTFRVEVGNKQYFELLDRVGSNNIAEELAFFSEKEVLKKGLCSTEKAITIEKGIYGPHTGEHVWLLVMCVE